MPVSWFWSRKVRARRHACPDSWRSQGAVVACRAGVARLKHAGVKADCHLDRAVPSAAPPDPTNPFTSARHNLGPKMDGTHAHNCLPWLRTLNVSQLPKIGLISARIAVTNVRVTLEECWISRL